MKVLILQSELGVLRGGGETFTRSLFAAFAARGHSVTAAFVADRQGYYPLSLPLGIKAIPLKGWWSRKLGEATLNSIGRRVTCNARLKTMWNRVHGAISYRILRSYNQRFQYCVEREFSKRWHEYDAVYVHTDVNLASKIADYRPTILRLPGPVGPEMAPLLRTVHAVCANGDALTTIRQFLSDHVVELSIGVDAEIFNPGPTPIRQKLGWGERHCIVGYVGRFTRLKGVDLLADAFREFVKTVPDVRLLMVGGGEEEVALRSILAKELAEGIVHIEPGVDHHTLPHWYRTMDLLIMPSRYENFSNAILEAMACGIPFLASDIGGNRVFAEKGVGWLFQPESVTSLTTQLYQISKSRAERVRRGQLGLSCVREQYSWTVSAERLEEIITSCLSEGSRIRGRDEE